MEVFPCPAEREVASALLLLATTPPSLSPPSGKSKCDGDDSESLVIVSGSDMNCSCSTVTSDDGFLNSAETCLRQLQMVAVFARRHELKLKVVKKRRSKSYWISDCPKIKPAKSAAVTWGHASGASEEASSCLSTGSSSSSISISCARSHTPASTAPEKPKRKNPAGSTQLRRRAEAILRLLSHGWASEVKLRQLLGDSPDTSKALRMLLKQAKVKRSGAGGRSDPYIYTKA